jgi:hypothetical protein
MSLTMLVSELERIAGFGWAGDFAQQPLETTGLVFRVREAASSLACCPQQVLESARWSKWASLLCPDDFPQQFPPQQHAIFLAVEPKQNSFSRPSGHRHMKWGVPATTVITAVSQTRRVRDSLRTECMIALTPNCPHSSPGVKLSAGMGSASGRRPCWANRRLFASHRSNRGYQGLIGWGQLCILMYSIRGEAIRPQDALPTKEGEAPNATGIRPELDGNAPGIPREYVGNPPMAADQPGFVPPRGLVSDRLPSSVINCHNLEFFFAPSTGLGGSRDGSGAGPTVVVSRRVPSPPRGRLPYQPVHAGPSPPSRGTPPAWIERRLEWLDELPLGVLANPSTMKEWPRAATEHPLISG